MPRKIAVIDVGSNSVRLMLGEEDAGVVRRMQKTLETTRIATGVDATGMLQPAPMQRSSEAIARFAQQARQAHHELLGAYATSAVRDAANAQDFVAMVRAQSGLTLDILSGAQESDIAFLGAAGANAGPCAVVDIGGGSTEISAGARGVRAYGSSVRVGAVRAMERFPYGDPVDAAMLAQLEAWALEQMQALASDLPRAPRHWLGVGGTLTTLCAMQLGLVTYDAARVQGAMLARCAVQAWQKRLSGMSCEARKAIPGLSQARADIIVAGATIALCVMRAFDMEAITISDSDGLEGYAYYKLSQGA
nr:Ppx/GppA phosphatase family protein [Maliibacterium massiliense]